MDKSNLSRIESANLEEGEEDTNNSDLENPSRLSTENRGIGGDISETFSLFRSYFDRQFKTLKKDLSQEAAKNLLKVSESKRKREPEFRYAGNKKQYLFNQEIQDKIQRSIAACEGEHFTEVKSSLEDINRDIKKRMKLIRLADKSEFGWDLVEEYLSDDVASDSDDAKRIRQAEDRVLRKR